MTMYLNDHQINAMATAAFNSYEMAADWNAAIRATHEFALDEIGVRPNRTAVLLAVKIAKTRWMGASMRVRQEVGA
jgi:hypothetical protein